MSNSCNATMVSRDATPRAPCADASPSPRPTTRRSSPASEHVRPCSPALLWEPRAATIPGIILLLVAALLCEAAVMTHVSTPTERERGFEDSNYTVDYRDCWVIERTTQSLPALGLERMRHKIPVLLRELWGGGSARSRTFKAVRGGPKRSYQHAPKLVRVHASGLNRLNCRPAARGRGTDRPGRPPQRAGHPAPANRVARPRAAGLGDRFQTPSGPASRLPPEGTKRHGETRGSAPCV